MHILMHENFVVSGSRMVGEQFASGGVWWKIVDGELHPDQGFLQICPKEIDGQLKCSCRKGCSSTRCSCCKSKMKCTQACKCGENCENIEEVACGEGKGHDSFNSSSESESED